MKAPKVDRYLFFFRREEIGIDDKSQKLMDQLYQLLSEIEPCGDDDRHTLWVRAERGTADDYGDFESDLADGDVSSREEFEDNWKSEYPDEYNYYHMTTVQHNGYRTIVLNGNAVIQTNPNIKSYLHDISDLLEWLITEVSNVLDLLRQDKYNQLISEILPYKYRKGAIPMRDYWDIFPEEEAEHFSSISREECAEFERVLSEADDDYSERKPRGRIEELTVNKYLQFCKLGYDENKLEGYDFRSALQMYKRYADDRDGGLLTIDPDSVGAFDRWYDLPNRDKWEIQNPSHMWEVCQGSSRVRIHLSVVKDEKGYYLYLSQNEYCSPQRSVRFYLALRRNNIPVFFDEGRRIAQYVSGRGKVGIVPCYTLPFDYYYGGYSDKDVGTFINLPDQKTDELIRKVTWYKIPEVHLKN